jgi:hypothetical protein
MVVFFFLLLFPLGSSAVWLDSWFGQPPPSYFRRILPKIEEVYLGQMNPAERDSFLKKFKQWEKCRNRVTHFFGPNTSQPQYLVGFHHGLEGKVVPWIFCDTGGQQLLLYGSIKEKKDWLDLLQGSSLVKDKSSWSYLRVPDSLVVGRLDLGGGAKWIELSAFVPDMAPPALRVTARKFFDELGLLADSWILHGDGTFSLVYP